MNKPKFKIGMTAPKVVAEIVRINEKIEIVQFVIYKPSLNFKKKGDLSLEQMSRHNYYAESIFLKRQEVLSGQIENTIARLKNDEALGIVSRVVIDGEIFHIPFLDFCCEKSPEKYQKIEEIVVAYLFSPGGVILDSGRSYHFYSSSLMSERIWYRFLGKCLLFDEYIDARYIGHRMLDGYGVLRISAGGIRPKIPKVV